MAIENAKNLNVRIKNKYDSYENWAASGLVLEAGEIAIAYSTVDVQVDNGTVKHPFLLMKVGDGEKTFANLPWLSAKAADVLEACKSESGLTAFVNTVIANAGIASDDAMQELAGKVTTAEGEIDALQADLDTAETGLKARMGTAEADIDALEAKFGAETVAAEIATALSNYTNTTDMKDEIANAYLDAEALATGFNTAMDARVKVVEGKAHTHTFVESELNLIKAGDVEKWNAAEKNAKDYADGLDKAMDERVDALEAKFTGEDSVADQIAAAVAAEAEIARAAEQANAKAITDLTNGAVKDNADAIDALEGLVGETSVSEQIENALKVEVDGAKVEKYALATALATEAATARAAEKANADAIDVLNGNAETAGSVDYKVAQAVSAIMENPDDTMNSINELVTWANDHASDALEMSNQVAANKTALETLNGDATKAGSVAKKIADAIAAENLGQYATDGELNALAGRVTTIETEHNAENTGLKARLTQAEADIDALETKVGDKTVAAQIEAAIEALKIGDYAKAADLTAAITQHNTDKAAIEASIATKANDADLAAVAKSGLIDDLSIGEGTVLVFDCGGSV